MPFLLPDHELAPPRGEELIREVAGILKGIERSGKAGATPARADLVKAALARIQPLVEEYFSVTEAERILIDDTLALWQPSIHRSSLDTYIPSLRFPEPVDRKQYANTLADVLNRRVRKQGIKIHAEGMASESLNLILLTIVFGNESKSYGETGGENELWTALDRLGKAAQRNNGPFSYLRGFSYFEPDRLHMLKPATMRNWCRTAALNDADAIFEHLVRRQRA